jgi:putative pyrimidine permease RutG
MAMFGFPHWQLKSTSSERGVVAPDERLPVAQTLVMGFSTRWPCLVPRC